MSGREWWTRLLGSLRRGRLEREMDAELRFHVEMATERNLRAGLSARDARRQALLAFGGADSWREAARGAQRARALEDVVADVRHTLRTMLKSPGFTLATMTTLALGIGASTAVFTFVNAVLLRPLPFPQAEDVQYIGWDWGDGRRIGSLTGFQLEFVRQHSRTFAAAATFRTAEEFVGDDDHAAPVRGLRISDDFFRVTGVGPVRGRGFSSDEMQPGSADVVVLSDVVWRTHFGADSALLGRQVRIAGEPHTVIGIMPADFRFPAAAEHLGYIVPLRLEVDPADEGHNYNVIARARTGTTAEQRAADLNALATAFRERHPELATAGESFALFTHADVYTGNLERTLWLLFAAVALLLLIACANTATLLLVRATARQRELAVRAALGAGRRRILRQLLTEGLVLSLLSATLGVAVAAAAVRVIVASSPATFVTTSPITIDLRVLTFAVMITILTALIFGLAAALPAFRTRLQGALLGSVRVIGNGSIRTREALVLVQTTLAVVLLVAASLVASGFVRLIRTDPGFAHENVLAIRLGRMPPGVSAEQRDALAERVVERVRALNGVRDVSVASNLPLERGLNFPIDIAERPDLGIGDVELRFVSPSYFETLDIPLRLGRDFDARDARGAEHVAIVNEAFARHFWRDASPLGRSVQIGHMKDRWLTPGLERQTRVVGLVADMRELGLDREPKPTVYVPRTQLSEGPPLLLVRAPPTPALTQLLRDAVRVEESRLVPQIEQLTSVVTRSVAAPRFRALILVAFAGSALLLAAVGIYGVNAAIVQQRRRELGLRMALGATRAQLAFAVVRHSLLLVAAGAAVGLLAAMAGRRLLAAMLYGISPTDARVFGAVLIILALIAAAASYVPARRAANTDPASSLRAE